MKEREECVMVVFGDLAITNHTVPTYLWNDYQKLITHFEHATLSDIHMMIFDYIEKDSLEEPTHLNRFQVMMGRHPEKCEDVLAFITKMDQYTTKDIHISRLQKIKCIVKEVQELHRTGTL